MTRREPDFEESADMRLVELQRASLGVAKPELGAWNTRAAAEVAAGPQQPEPEVHGAVLALELTATPAAGVIPGAIVTLALSLVNEGTKAAGNARVCVPMPGGAAFRNGSLIRDGRPVLDEMADELFAAGLPLGTIAAGSRVTLVWKIGVRLGNKPLVIAPTATAEETAVVGARTLVISRKDGAAAGFAAEVERVERALPIYELDEEETLEHEAANAALSPAAEYRPPMEPPMPSAPPPSQPEPLPPPDQPAPIPDPGAPEPEPSMPAPPEEPPSIEPAAAARSAVVFYGRIDRPSIVYFDRMFNGDKPPTLLSHFIFGGALACKAAPGEGSPALERHMQAQQQLLQRLVLHEKMGKKEPIAQYTGQMLADTAEFKAAPVSEPAMPDGNAVLLEAELETPTLGVLEKMQEDPARWDFTKARQLTLALQARRVIARAPEERIAAAEQALRAYAQTSGTQLQRFFVRMRLDRTTGLLFTGDETLDAAARRAIAALTALF